MYMEESYPTPKQWIRESWNTSRLDLLEPAVYGLAGGQLLMALLGLRSVHTVFVMLCLAASVFAAYKTVALMRRMRADCARDTRTTLTHRDTQELFVPLILSMAVYGIIAPNAGLGIIFAAITAPHLCALLYLVTRYTDIAPATRFQYPGVFALRTRGLQTAQSLLRIFRRTPDFTSR